MEKALYIRFDPDSGVPAVRQITNKLRIFLVGGKFPPGTLLPSTRRLAMELGVHFGTVAEAYRELATEGWLDLRHGRGAIVLARSVRPMRRKVWVDEFRDRLLGLIAQTLARGALAEELAAELRAVAKEVG
jgi:DNA-binding transcriptional regulator YhcF (GntR family)